MNQASIAFIGGGNMASSIVRGLIADGYPQDKLWVTDVVDARVNELTAQLGVNGTTRNVEAVMQADVVVFAVKPQVMPAVCRDLREVVQAKKPLIISVAVGVSTAQLARWLGDDLAMVRSMPNTPSLIGTGATGLFQNAQVTEEQRNIAESIHRAVGVVIWVTDESLIDVVAALSGSGPAYFFYFMELMADVATTMGLDSKTANLLALQTALGASKLALESDDEVALLRRKVTSPKGTTEQAIHVFSQQLPALVADAMQAAVTRAVQLTEELDGEK